jgi:predicted amidohydrolase
LTIAAIQTSPVTSDLDATWQRFADQVYAVKDTFGRVELVVVPELLLTAEPPLLQARAEWTEQVAVSIPGRLTHRICALAKETVLWLVPGSLYERDGDDIYNTAIAVSPDGEIVTKYLNGADPWGVGASAIVDPEGVIRQQAGPGEEIHAMGSARTARRRRAAADVRRLHQDAEMASRRVRFDACRLNQNRLAVRPPSTTNVPPVQNSDRSPARNSATLATSSTVT